MGAAVTCLGLAVLAWAPDRQSVVLAVRGTGRYDTGYGRQMRWQIPAPSSRTAREAQQQLSRQSRCQRACGSWFECDCGSVEAAKPWQQPELPPEQQRAGKPYPFFPTPLDESDMPRPPWKSMLGLTLMLAQACASSCIRSLRL